ncbi:MAG: hypothetical protein ABI780_11295 [Ardenticatenales bacterium]
MDQIVHLIQTVATLLAMTLPVIGVTGGLQQFFGEAPDIPLGPFTIKGGQWLSALIAIAFDVIAHVAGWLPALGTYGSVQAASAAEWAILVALTSVVYGIGGMKQTPGPEPLPAGPTGPTGKAWQG